MWWDNFIAKILRRIKNIDEKLEQDDYIADGLKQCRWNIRTTKMSDPSATETTALIELETNATKVYDTICSKLEKKGYKVERDEVTYAYSYGYNPHWECRFHISWEK